MKLNIPAPGDSLILNKDGSIQDTLTRGNWVKDQYKTSGINGFPADTKLTISQVYIRKNGWDENSFTFKLEENSDAFNKLFKSYCDNERRYVLQRLKFLRKERRELKTLNVDGHIVGETGGLTLARMIIGAQPKPRKPFHIKFNMNPGETDDEFVNRMGLSVPKGACHYASWTMKQLNEDIARLEKDLASYKNKTKGSYTSALSAFKRTTWRVLLTDIESWDVDLVKKQK